MYRNRSKSQRSPSPRVVSPIQKKMVKRCSSSTPGFCPKLTITDDFLIEFHSKDEVKPNWPEDVEVFVNEMNINTFGSNFTLPSQQSESLRHLKNDNKDHVNMKAILV